ncbi:hypothetical protein CFIO01_08913 [Colletotrichum fioriniae PJ7]|uniref:Uncharacterized protein n=1 Tax=Colletotrichum fioriniae PJ7 TaxID=1445577 RepID=A0A010S8J9_9PEZI|nr:hypothetical protein CFIO01_08913 [Colletotrichum fioriniae PJ7]
MCFRQVAARGDYSPKNRGVILKTLTLADAAWVEVGKLIADPSQAKGSKGAALNQIQVQELAMIREHIHLQILVSVRAFSQMNPALKRPRSLQWPSHEKPPDFRADDGLIFERRKLLLLFLQNPYS